MGMPHEGSEQEPKPLSDSKINKIHKLVADGDTQPFTPHASDPIEGDDNSPTAGFDHSPYQDSSSRSRSSDSDRFTKKKKFKQGGLGVVFSAQDIQLNRTVALKQIHESFASEPLAQEKFYLEAEVTGQLEHPGIVPVYSFGIDRDGRPFYAMRFIHGVELETEIHAFHESVKDSSIRFDGIELRQLLRRFINVCNAVEYAHSRGVLHRDLKPKNIMVGKYGETLVVDWGLAKLLHREVKAPGSEPSEQESTDIQLSGSHDETRQGSFNGTYHYAAPEQLLGKIDLLSPAADVYSLGAVLYHILVGKRPEFQADLGKDAAAYARQIENGFLRSPRAINPLVPKPLDCICMKAMAYQISLRYSSALALAEDVERWLADDPILAYNGREPRLEQAGRILRKHRSWTISLLAAFLVISSVSTAATYVVNEYRLSETRAKEREQAAKIIALDTKNFALDRVQLHRESIDGILTEFEDTVWLANSRTTRDLRKRILASVREDFDRMSTQRSKTPELDIERVRASVRIGDLLHIQGEYKDAHQQYETALDLLDKEYLLDRSSVSAAELSEWKLIGEMERARIHTRIGKALASEPNGSQFHNIREHFDLATQILQNLQASGNENSFLVGNLAVAFHEKAAWISNGANPDSYTELKLLEEAVPYYDAAVDGGEIRFAVRASQCREQLGRLLRKSGKVEASDRVFEESERRLEALIASSKGKPEFLDLKASLHVSIANLERQRGAIPKMFRELRNAAAIYHSLNQSFGDNLRFTHGRLLTQVNIGVVLLDLYSASEAFDVFNEAVLDLESISAEYPAAEELYATSLSGLGQSMSMLGEDLTQADGIFSDSIEILSNLIKRSAKNQRRQDGLQLLFRLATDEVHRANLHRYLRSYEQAETEYNQAQNHFEQLSQELGTEHEAVYQLALAHWQKGLLMIAMNNEERAKLEFDESNRLARESMNENENTREMILLAKHLLYCPIPLMRDVSEALSLSQKCYDRVPENLEFALTYADALSASREFEKAMQVLPKFEQDSTAFRTQHHLSMATAFAFQSKWDDAERALESAKRFFSEDCPTSFELEFRTRELESMLTNRRNP